MTDKTLDYHPLKHLFIHFDLIVHIIQHKRLNYQKILVKEIIQVRYEQRLLMYQL